MKEKKLLEFDPANATDEQIRAWLFAIIDQELDKPEGQEDTELIRECSECEMYLSGSENTLTEAQYLAGLAKIKQHTASMNEKKAHKPRVWRRLPALLAAVLALIVLSAGAVAAASGSAAWEFITTNIQQILGMEPGETLEGDKVTLVKGDLVAEYDSVEEALKAGGFEGILYPSVLPEGVEIERIVVTQEDDNLKIQLSFVTNSNEFLYEVYNHEYSGMKNWANIEQVSYNKHIFYISCIDNMNQYQIGCYHNGFEHIMIVNSSEILEIILNNMEEIK